MEELDKIYKEFGDGPLDYMYFQFNMDIIREYLEGKEILEMSTNIYSTLELARLGKEVLTIDGSVNKINDLVKVILSRNVTNVMCVAAYFEEWFKSPFKRYDEVVLFRALEHVDDPVEVLSLIKNSMKADGHVNISVPNANSLHRRLGVKLGMLPYTEMLSDADLTKGHKRVYTVETLVRDVKQAGLEIEFVKGSFLKIGNDAEMKRNTTFYHPKMFKGIFDLSQDLDPDLGAELIVRARV